MKRLYAQARVVDLPEGFAIALDDRPIKTPGRWPLALPTAALADAVADEWRAQGSQIKPETMPLMQLAATVLDHVALYRDQVRAATLRFAATDVVCYRATQPAELVRLQQVTWQPLIDWLADAYGVRLAVTDGLIMEPQPPDALAALAEMLERLNDWRLCAFQAATATAGSFVIALAMLDSRLDADDAFRAAELEASFEIDRWGEDVESTARRRIVAADLAAAARFHRLLGA